MEFLSRMTFELGVNLPTALMVGGVFFLAIVMWGVYRWFFVLAKTGLGSDCNPQIENSCGENAVCHSSEPGKKGTCLPKPVPVPVAEPEPEAEAEPEATPEAAPETPENKE
jgi:hypothetical protein